MAFIKIGNDQYNLGDVSQAVEHTCENFIGSSNEKFDASVVKKDSNAISEIKDALLKKIVEVVEDNSMTMGEKVYFVHHLSRAKAVDHHQSIFSKNFTEKTTTKKFFNKLRESLLDEVRAVNEDNHKATKKILAKREKLISKIKRKS